MTQSELVRVLTLFNELNIVVPRIDGSGGHGEPLRRNGLRILPTSKPNLALCNTGRLSAEFLYRFCRQTLFTGFEHTSEGPARLLHRLVFHRR